MQDYLALLDSIEDEIKERLSRLGQKSVRGRDRKGFVTATLDIRFTLESLEFSQDAQKLPLSELGFLTKEAINQGVKKVKKILKRELADIIGDDLPSPILEFLGKVNPGSVSP